VATFLGHPVNKVPNFAVHHGSAPFSGRRSVAPASRRLCRQRKPGRRRHIKTAICVFTQ